MKITIGLSRGSGSPKYENYGKWLSTLPEYDIEVLDLSVGDLDADLQRIDGLVLTGGGDIDPSLYDREDARSLCDGIDPERDRMESAMVDYCTSSGIPSGTSRRRSITMSRWRPRPTISTSPTCFGK